MPVKQRKWSCSVWTREGSCETLQSLQYLKGAVGDLERSFVQGHELIGQGRMTFNWKRAGLDWTLGQNSLLWEW